MMKTNLFSRLIGLSLLCLAALSLGLPACSASTETKQGARGEYCANSDSDCRDGLTCVNRVCTPLNSRVEDACQASCDKVTACALNDQDCVAECAETLKNWSNSVIDKFTGCIVDDLECHELGASDNEAAQICYDRLEVPAERLMRCTDLRAALVDCQADGYDTRPFEGRCLRMARTTDEETWAKTDPCTQTDQCSDTTACINEVFGI